MSVAKLKVQLESNSRGVREKDFSCGGRIGKTVGFPADSIAKHPTQTGLNKNVILILNNIRSVFNVGSIFRTADGAGINKIYLVGVTPDPIDRFGRERKDLAKVALGAEKKIQWEHVEDLDILIQKLKQRNYQVVALEQAKNSIDYKIFKPKFPFALLLGEEVNGLSEQILSQCDYVIEIPMLGEKESLNVSVATGIALFRILDI